MDDDVGLEIRTKQFACGDSYRGSWNASGLPDGQGKYTWRDGSTYDGSWKDGLLHGVGRYTWADGATYRGEWREGCMHGIGVWESADGRRRYQGGWHANAPHGLGRMAFAHGDVYEGLWSLGLPSGPGRYVYGSGGGGGTASGPGGEDAAPRVTNGGGGGDSCAEYDGEWLAGRMHGHGTCVWASGERYDGTWRDGRMHGVGLLVGADGSLYDGCWRRGRKHGVGVLRPGRTAVPPVATVAVTFPASPAAGTARGALDRALQRLRFSSTATGPGTAEGEVGTGDVAIPFPSAPASPAPGGSPRGAASPRASPRGVLGPVGVGYRADSPQKGAGGLGSGGGSGGGSRDSNAMGMGNGSGAGAESKGVDGMRLRLRLLAEAGGSSGGASVDEGSGSAPQSPVVRWVRQCPDSDGEEGGEGGRQGQGQGQGRRQGHVGGAQQAAEELLSSSTTDLDSLAPTPKTTPHRSRPPQLQLPASSALLATENGGSPGSPGLGPFSHGGSGPLSPSSGGGRPCYHVRCYARGVPLRETLLPAELVEAALPLHLRPGAAAKRQRERPLLRLVRPGPAAGPRRPRPRLGDPVSTSHPRYALVVALQLGIRFSVGRVSHEPLPRHPSPDEFTMQVTQEFARCGSEVTPVHPVQDFVWEDFAPMVFRRLRDLCGVDAGAYLRSLCCGSSLRHLASPGKSGSAFFVSQDERFFIKSMSRSELRLLLSALPAYLDHLAAHPHSLLCRFMGLHAITAPGGKKYLFVVMSNVFRSDHQQLLPLHRRYDLKGSTLGRTAGPAARASSAPQVSLGTPGTDVSTSAGDRASHHSAGASLLTQQPWSPESEFDPDVILKDLDLDVAFRLGDGWRDRLLSQLRADSALLASLGVMDYSLLVGVHFRRAGGDTAAAAGGEGAGSGGAGGAAGSKGGSAHQELSQVADRISKLRLPPKRGLGVQGGEDGAGGGGAGSGAGSDSGSGGRAEALKRDLLVFARDRILGTPEGSGCTTAAPPGNSVTWRTADSAPHPGPGFSPGPRAAALSPEAGAAAAAASAAAAAAPGPSLNDALALSLGQGSVTLGVAMAGVAVRKEQKQHKQQRSNTPFRGRSTSPSPPALRAETARSEPSNGHLQHANDDRSERGDETVLQGQGHGQGVEVVLWFALIDILQPFTPAKRLEAGFKGLLHAPSAVSVAAPQAYAARFQSFMREVFCE